MSYTQTEAPYQSMETVFLHPRPFARNSGVLVLLPLLPDLPSEPQSSTLRVIADVGSPRTQRTPVSSLCGNSDRPSLIPGLPFKRLSTKVNCEPPHGPPVVFGVPRRLAAESVPLCPTISELPCKPTAESLSKAAVVTVSPPRHPLPSDAHRKPTTELSGKLLPPELPRLPVESWYRIFAFVFTVPSASIGVEERRARVGLMRVSKTFKNLASPLFYAYPYFSTSSTFTAFTHVLQASDRAWDSLRRIPYSTPGRWVQALDLSRISCTTAAERLAVDTLLTQLFPLTPFLAYLVLNSTVRLSRRAMVALAAREGAGLLRVLKGVKWEGGGMPVWDCGEDPLLALVRASVGLEELEVFGPGLQDDENDDGPVTPQLSTPSPTPLPPLCLPNLHSLMILSLPKSPLLSCLLRSPLPSLRHLMVTPYDGMPFALTSALITTHGARLHTLAFHTPKTWPVIRAPTPPTLLHTSPHLRALSLTFPLPPLAAPPSAPATGHPLRILSLPRPDPAYLYKLEAWLYLGLLQCLEEVHMREVRWIRAGVSSRAAEAGVQGDMKEWKRRLGRWKVKVVDVSGREDTL